MSSAQVAYTVLEVLIAVFCCIGNVLVIWAVWSSKSLRQPTFYFIASLAVADFLLGCVAVPIALVVDGQMETLFHSCLFMSCFVLLLPQASMLSLLAIAVDRYLRVQIPLRYKQIITQKRSWLIVAASWVVAVILSFLPMFGWYKHDTMSTNSTTIMCKFVSVIPMSYLVYCTFLVCTAIPLLVMALLYCYIFCTIRRNLRGKAESSNKSQSHAYLKKERSLAASLFLVLVLFAVCWLPLHIVNCLAHFGINVPLSAIYAGILLSHANSAVNPIVYAFKIQKIKQEYMTIWRKFTVCDEDPTGSPSNQSNDNNHSSNLTSVAKVVPHVPGTPTENFNKTPLAFFI